MKTKLIKCKPFRESFFRIFSCSLVIMYYRPVLPNGEFVPLPWQIRIFFLNITWPLQDNPATWMKVLHFIKISFAILIFAVVNESEMHFIVRYFKNINLSVEALVTWVVLNETFLRIFNMAFTNRSFKLFLKEYYKSIYIDKKEDLSTWKNIHRGLIPTTVYTYGYIATIASFISTPFINLLRNEKSLPYKMILPYKYDDPFVYSITLTYLCWIGGNIVLFFIAESFLLASCILHLNARYIILQEDIQQSSIQYVSKVPDHRLAFEFRRNIFKMFRKNCDLNRFAALLNETYSFRIFIMLAFSTALLCVLCFQVTSVGASSGNITYVSWIIAKISELLIFGSLGSTLTQTTDKMSSMYYLSNWEQIVFRSKNSEENALLIKDLQIIMSLQKTPIHLSGLNYIDVSLDTMVKILRGAFSCFTCLYTLKETSGN